MLDAMKITYILLRGYLPIWAGFMRLHSSKDRGKAEFTIFWPIAILFKIKL